MKLPTNEGVDFGALPEEINGLLQQGVLAYRRDRAAAERFLRDALARAPHELAIYFCLYKTHVYRGNLDDALAAAEQGLREAARQAGWGEDIAQFPRAPVASEGPARFALYTLKALAFIHLRRDDRERARQMLSALAALDPDGKVGWHVVLDLTRGLA